MDLGAILLLIALLLVVGLFLAAPLMNNRPRGAAPETAEVSSLMAERDRVITALQELDFDFKLGKIPEEDYPPQRASLVQKGADILRKLDVLAPALDAAGIGWPDANSRLEQAARADSGRAAKVLADDEIESMLAARRGARRARRHTGNTGVCSTEGHARPAAGRRAM
jgi:hypothetical protein